jgi:hypothetical protein
MGEKRTDKQKTRRVTPGFLRSLFRLENLGVLAEGHPVRAVSEENRFATGG